MAGAMNFRPGSIAILLTMLLCVRSFGEVRVSLTEAAAPPGGIVALQLSLEDSDDLPTSLVVNLLFETTAIHPSLVTPGSAAGSASLDYTVTESGATLILFGGAEPFTVGKLATIYLELEESTTLGSTLQLSNGLSSSANVEAQALEISLPSSSVTVAALTHPHDADTNTNGRLELSELLRVVQLYSVGEFYCGEDTDDGFSPVVGTRDCARHDLDFNTPEWQLGLSELLRCIQFFNAFSGTYHANSGSEDGYASGTRD